MKSDIRDYLQEVCSHLPSYVDRERVRADLGSHLEEVIYELEAEGMNEAKALKAALHRMGNPREVAQAYRTARPFSASEISCLLFIENGLLFMAGAVLVMMQAKVDSGELLGALYGFLTANKEWILLGYALCWLLAGYVMGRKYGVQAERNIKAVIRFPLILNYLFMLLVLYKLIPPTWFQSLLSTPFVMLCIMGTLMFGKLARIGCGWGRKYT